MQAVPACCAHACCVAHAVLDATNQDRKFPSSTSHVSIIRDVHLGENHIYVFTSVADASRWKPRMTAARSALAHVCAHSARCRGRVPDRARVRTSNVCTVMKTSRFSCVCCDHVPEYAGVELRSSAQVYDIAGAGAEAAV